jgi:hypothetical protein
MTDRCLALALTCLPFIAACEPTPPPAYRAPEPAPVAVKPEPAAKPTKPAGKPIQLKVGPQGIQRVGDGKQPIELKVGAPGSPRPVRGDLGQGARPRFRAIAPPSDVSKPPGNARKTPAGLFYRVLEEGTGKSRPRANSTVEVHYTGWTTDGRMFDSSVARGRPARLNLTRVIPGWSEGLQLMVEGEKRRVWIPEELAYKGRPGAPQGMLVFDVELLRILQ